MSLRASARPFRPEPIPIYVTSSGSRAYHPSPCTYDPKKPFGADVTPRRIHSRLPSPRTDFVPPPGTYNTGRQLGSLSKGRLGGPPKRSPYDIVAGPGPAAYDRIVVKLPSPIRIGEKSRRERQPRSPPPGAYDTVPRFGATRCGGRILGESARMPFRINRNPGPAQYGKIETTLPSPIRIGQTIRQNPRPLSPPPGAYDPFAAFDAAQRGGRILGTGDRSPYAVNNNPGPAAYKPLETTLPSPIRIGEITRPARRQPLPGPGHYEAIRGFGSTLTGGRILGEGPRTPYGPQQKFQPGRNETGSRSSSARGKPQRPRSQSARQTFVPPSFWSNVRRSANSPRVPPRESQLPARPRGPSPGRRPGTALTPTRKPFYR
jgi:hypothetical protein